MSGSVRIYDLAKEVKLEPKRVIEELRREGADVSVPSNTVSNDLAEKIRRKYFPKVETAPKRKIVVIKKKARPDAPEEAEEIETDTAAETPEKISRADGRKGKRRGLLKNYRKFPSKKPNRRLTAEPEETEEDDKSERKVRKLVKKTCRRRGRFDW